jgi:hypothetical protein
MTNNTSVPPNTRTIVYDNGAPERYYVAGFDANGNGTDLFEAFDDWAEARDRAKALAQANNLPLKINNSEYSIELEDPPPHF